MLTVVSGDKFEVVLDAGSTAGYQWVLPSTPAGVVLLGTDARPPPDAAVGSSGEQVFHLRADHPGRYALHFQLKRPWEAAVLKAQVIELDAG